MTRFLFQISVFSWWREMTKLCPPPFQKGFFNWWSNVQYHDLLGADLFFNFLTKMVVWCVTVSGSAVASHGLEKNRAKCRLYRLSLKASKNFMSSRGTLYVRLSCSFLEGGTDTFFGRDSWKYHMHLATFCSAGIFPFASLIWVWRASLEAFTCPHMRSVFHLQSAQAERRVYKHIFLIAYLIFILSPRFASV